jgi:mRNA-degrading endonuclease HigB of HigAB toxin-antitoxin module
MRVIKKRTLKEFWERTPDAKQGVLAWYAEAEDAAWLTPADIKAQYGNASIVAGIGWSSTSVATSTDWWSRCTTTPG